VLMFGRDGALRDMASIHGSYRKVEETVPALELTTQTLAELRVAGLVERGGRRRPYRLAAQGIERAAALLRELSRKA